MNAKKRFKTRSDKSISDFELICNSSNIIFFTLLFKLINLKNKWSNYFFSNIHVFWFPRDEIDRHKGLKIV